MRTDRQTHLIITDRRAIDALVERLLTNHREDVKHILLFGSKARGDDTLESDIDVLIVAVNEDWPLKHSLRKIGARVSLEHDVLFNLYVIGVERWRWMQEINHPLYRTIAADGIDLTPASITEPSR